MQSKLHRLLAIYQRARKVHAGAGVPLSRQAIEVLRLRRGIGALGLDDYYEFGVYGKNPEEQSRFVGWSGELSLNRFFNRDAWAAFSYDKIAFYTLLEANGLPYPRVQAVVSARPRLLGNVELITDAQRFRQFLESRAQFPIFVKPSHGNFGRGALRLDGLGEDGGTVRTNEGALSIQRLYDQLEKEHSHGQLLQDLMVLHPDLAKLIGSTPATVRFSGGWIDGDFVPISSLIKLPVGENIIDNFKHGRTGNLLAALDSTTGRIERIIGRDRDGAVYEVPEHPDTGQSLGGMSIPDWPLLLETARSVAVALPGYRLVHLDICPSDRGPLLLEVNIFGNMDLHQVASGRGFMNPTFQLCYESQKRYKEREQALVRQITAAEASTGGA